jgi:hypothetical protein
MADYPLVRIRREQRSAKRIPGRKPYFPRVLPVKAQAARHQAVFDRIDESHQRIVKGIEVSGDPSAATPDRALVFELIGPVADFAKAARDIGFEWLAEDFPLETNLDESGEAEEEEPEADGEAEVNRLYLTMPSLASLGKLLSLWRLYSHEESPPDNNAKDWWKIFGYLSDLRMWNVRDRLDPLLSPYTLCKITCSYATE